MSRPPFPQEYRCGVPFPLNDKTAVEKATKIEIETIDADEWDGGLLPRDATKIARAVCPMTKVVCREKTLLGKWLWLFKQLYAGGFWACRGRKPQAWGKTMRLTLAEREFVEGAESRIGPIKETWKGWMKPDHAGGRAADMGPGERQQGRYICDYTKGDYMDYWVWLFRAIWSSGWWRASDEEEPDYCAPTARGCNRDECLAQKHR